MSDVSWRSIFKQKITIWMRDSECVDRTSMGGGLHSRMTGRGISHFTEANPQYSGPLSEIIPSLLLCPPSVESEHQPSKVCGEGRQQAGTPSLCPTLHRNTMLWNAFFVSIPHRCLPGGGPRKSPWDWQGRQWSPGKLPEGQTTSRMSPRLLFLLLVCSLTLSFIKGFNHMPPGAPGLLFEESSWSPVASPQFQGRGIASQWTPPAVPYFYLSIAWDWVTRKDLAAWFHVAQMANSC